MRQIWKQTPIRAEMVEEGGVSRKGGVDLSADADACFIGPEAGHVTGRVAASTDDKEGQVEGFDEFDAGAVGTDVEVEAAEAVAAKGVGTTLEDDGCGVVFLDAGTDDFAEEGSVAVIVDAV